MRLVRAGLLRAAIGVTLPLAFGGFGLLLVVLFGTVVWFRLRTLESDMDDVRADQRELTRKIHAIAGIADEDGDHDAADSG